MVRKTSGLIVVARPTTALLTANTLRRVVGFSRLRERLLCQGCAKINKRLGVKAVTRPAQGTPLWQGLPMRTEAPGGDEVLGKCALPH